MGLRRGRLAALVSLAAAMTMAAAVPVAAGGAPAPADSGRWGLHALRESLEFPSVTCDYDEGLVLQRIRARAPFVFARDRSSGIDSQTVGLRNELWVWTDTAYERFASKPIVKRTATDRRPAAFPDVTWDAAGFEPGTFYLQVYRITWYTPGTTNDPEGRARHYAQAYRTDSVFLTPGYVGCPVSPPKGLPAPLDGTHSGHPGRHWLLSDYWELGTVRCRYTDDALPLLDRIRVLQPMVFARDTGGGVQTQTVGWRIRIEHTDDPDPNAANWTVHDQLPFVKATATDRAPAIFTPQAYDFGANVDDHVRYRVAVDIRWYGSGGTITGMARHHVSLYQIAWAGGINPPSSLPCYRDYD